MPDRGATSSISILGGTLSATGLVDIQDGELSGTGSVDADLTNAGDLHVAGIGATGTLNVTGIYTQTSTGKLSVELGGTSTSLYGSLAVTGTATLDGELEVTTETFSPTTGNMFQALTSTITSGTFSTEPAGFTTTYDSPSAGDVTIEAL